jgi:hypothetical protein
MANFFIRDTPVFRKVCAESPGGRGASIIAGPVPGFEKNKTLINQLLDNTWHIAVSCKLQAPAESGLQDASPQKVAPQA